MNPDVRAADHLRRTRHVGRSLSEQRARRAGHQALAAGVVCTHKALPTAQPREWPCDRHYQGAELRPFDQRAGAMDAFDKPSMINGRLRPRREPSRYTEASEGATA